MPLTESSNAPLAHFAGTFQMSPYFSAAIQRYRRAQPGG